MGTSSETVLKIMEPATEQVLAELPHAGVEETDAAVARAKAAFDGWRAVTPGDRARVLRAIADAITDHAEELARLEARNVGKPIGDARGEVGWWSTRSRTTPARRSAWPERLSPSPAASTSRSASRSACRTDHPVEFPPAITSWKVAPALGRQHGRPQAGRADAADGDRVGEHRA